MPYGIYPHKKKPLLDRLFAKLDISSGCWEWTGAQNGSGYGRINSGNGNYIYVHRAVYEMQHGPILPRLQLDHLCRNTICCNPTHVEPVTCMENVARGLNPKKTHCINGHKWEGNEMIRKNNKGRACKQCQRDSRNTEEYRASRRKPQQEVPSLQPGQGKLFTDTPRSDGGK